MFVFVCVLWDREREKEREREEERERDAWYFLHWSATISLLRAIEHNRYPKTISILMKGFKFLIFKGLFWYEFLKKDFWSTKT